MSCNISLRHILRAQRCINPYVRRTPVVLSSSLSQLAGSRVYLKLEHQQVTGSFKLRGALNAVLSLSRQERRRGMVGVSTGNYGRALAYSAAQNGVKCIICMSSLVPRNKVQGVQDAGAEVRIIGRNQDEVQLEVDRLINEEKMILLPPFDHPDLIAGQGTLGLEIIEGAGSVDVGALLAGKTKADDAFVMLLYGCNIDPVLHHQVISEKMKLTQ